MQSINKQQYHTHIEPHQRLLDLNLKEVWRYRDVVLLFTKRSFTVLYKQTILGPAWILLNPFFTSVIFTIVFGNIAGISTEGVPQLLFYLGSNAVWSFFAGCLNNTANTFTANAAIFGKVYFPRLTMPISTVLSAVVNFAVQFLMFCAFFVYFLAAGKVHPHWETLWLLPVLLLQLGCLGLGCGIIISSLTTKYRDLAVAVGFGVQLWMYATPVVYPISQISDAVLRRAIHLNPVTQAIESFRYAFLGVGELSIRWWSVSVAITLAVLFIGVVIFNKIEKTFMDTV